MGASHRTCGCFYLKYMSLLFVITLPSSFVHPFHKPCSPHFPATKIRHCTGRERIYDFWGEKKQKKNKKEKLSQKVLV